MKVTRRTGSLVIVLVIFAAIVLGTALAAIAIDKSEIPMLQQHAAEAAVTADGYTHGSNIGTSPSGTSISVNNASAFVTALTVNNSINLQKDIELSSDQVKQICNTEYGGTLYGNGHTITVSFPSTGNAASVKITPNTTSAYGGLVGKLTGKIYDLNFVHTGGQLNVQSSAGYSGFAGGLVGSVEGGTIENVRVELSYKNGGRVGFVKGTATDGKYVAAGAMAGRIFSGTIKNVTVVNNAWIEAGVWASNNGANSTTVTDQDDSFVGNVAGIIGTVQGESWSGSVTMDNIIVEGHDTVNGATLQGRYATNLGTAPISNSITITVKNFYNKFRNKFSAYTNGSSTTFATAGTNNSLNITNLYKSANATSVSSSANIPGNNTVTIPNDADYSIYFDPKADDVANSLVVVKSDVTGGANYRATITGVNNNSYSDGYYAFNSTGDTVVFRGLPTAASNWSKNGTFNCTITTTRTEIQVPTYDDLTKWEHGYVSADTTTSGTEAISTGTQFENIFRPNGSLNQSGTYYLTDDIAITGFTGKTFGGTLDGNGHTIFIVASNTGMTGPHIGGLVGTLSGTIKNVRVVLMLPDNTQVTCTNGKGGDDFVIGFGGVVGKINGGTVENVNVVIPSGYTFSAGWSGSGSDVGVGGIAGSMIGSGTVTNCTVQVDGDIRASSGWPFASGIVGATGKEQNYNEFPFRFTNIILKGIGTIGGTTTDSSNTTQPTFAAAITITPPITGNTISIDGFIYNMTGENGPTWGSGGGAGSGYRKVSSWGYVCQNNDNGRPTAGVGLSADGKISYSNIYDMGSLMYDTVAENGFTSGGDLIWHDTDNHDGNVYYNMTRTAEIKSTVADSTIPVTPYFPASANGNLVLVAGDGTVTVPDLQYTNKAGTAFKSTADGNYKVVTVAKANVNTATVTLEEPVAVIVTVNPMNQWEHGYVSSTTTSGTAIGSAEEFEKYFSPSGNGSLSNGTYYLTGDITIKGFTGKTFSGTLDGNGHTIYIAATNTGMTGKPIGGLVGELTGKIKNVRVVIGNNVTVGTTATGGSGSYPMIGGIVGYLNGGTLENVQVVVPKDITFATQQFSSNLAFGGMVGEMNNATLTKVTAVIDGTLAPYGSYVWAAALVGKQAQNGTASTLTDVIVRGEGTFNATSSNSGGTHEDAFLAAVTVFQESSNAKRATVNGVIIDFTPTLNACDCYGIFTNNNYGGGSGADYSNIVEASNIYVINQTSDKNTSGNKAINESAVTSTIKNAVQGLPDIPVTPYFPISYNENGTVNTDNLVLVAGNGKDSFTTPVAYNNDTKSFVSEAVTVEVKVGEESITYQVVTVAKSEVKTNTVSLEIAAVNNPELTTTDFTYNGKNGIDVTIGALKYGSDVLVLDTDYRITIAAVAGGTGFVGTTGKPVNAGKYTLTVTLIKHIFADGSTEKVLNFTVSPKAVTVTVTADDREYDGTTNVTLSGGALSGVVSGDEGYVTADLGTGTAAQADVGTGISVTVKVELTGDRAANYVLQSQPTVTVNITPKVISFTAGRTSFLFADTSGIAITDHNLIAGNTYLLDVDGDKAYTLKVSEALTYVTDNTDSRTNYLAVGEYTVTLSPASGNYTFGSNNTFTFDVTKNESANTWITEYARDGWTYYSDPTAETAPVTRFGTANVSYVGVTEFSKTTAKGDYTVNVSVAETDNYGALTKEYSFTVSALDVTVALSAAGTVYDGQAYEASNISITLTATVNGTETTYTSADNSSDVSTLLRNYGWQYSAEGVTETTDGLPTNAGIYTLYIYNYSNSNVNVTGTLNCTATIAKAEVTFSAAIAGGAELVYGTVPEDFNSLVNVTASGGINLSAEDWSFAVTPSVASGEYTAKTPAGTTVTLTVQVDVTDPNHTAVQPAEILTLVIQKADIGEISVTNFDSVTIDFTSYKGFVYGQAKALEFSGIPADLTVEPVYTYAVQGGEAIDKFDIVTANSGIYTVTVKITGDTNYNDKTSEAIVFAIAQADRSVTVSIDGWTYGDKIDIADKLVIEGIQESDIKSVTYSGETNAGTEYSSTTVPKEAGTYTVTVSWVETTNYTAGEAVSKEFTIARATGSAKISVNGTLYTEKVTAYYTGSEQTFTVTVKGHDGGAIHIDGNPSSTMDYNLKNVEKKTVKVTVAQTANYDEATATAIIEILPAVIQSVTLGTTEFDFGTLNTENANDAATYGTPGVTFVNGKGSPEFTYSLAYSKTEKGNDEITYISFGTYTLTMKLTGETATNFVFDGGTATVQVTKVKNTWISEDKIVDYPFGLEGKPVKGTAKFGTAAVTYYREGKAIEFNFKPRKQDAGTYTAVVSVPANDNYDGISYEYTFVVNKHDLNITDLEISGTGVEVSGSAEDGFTVTYAPDMGLSATVDVGYMEGYQGLLSDLLGDLNTRTYLFEYSADAAEPKVWTDGLPENAGTYTVRFKGMELAADYNINNFKYNQPEVGLTIDPAKITVTAGIPENAAVVYGMTKDEISNLITLTPKEGVTLGEVTVTYNNGTPYVETVLAGTELTISVSVNAENENYIAEFEGGNTSTVLTATVQKATLHVSYAESSSVLSADFDPDKFEKSDKYAAITAKWNGKEVTASDYFDVTLTGYEGEVTGMTPAEFFANKEIGTYTFTVTLQADDAVNFVTDPETIVYELTLAKNTVKLTVAIDSWTYGDSPATPEFTAIVTDEEGNETDILQIVGQSITVKYSNDSGDDLPGQPTDAGTYTLTANIVGHHDYVAENAATAKFTITARSVSFVADIAGVSAKYNRNTEISSDRFIETFGGYFVLAGDNSYAYDHALADVFNVSVSLGGESAEHIFAVGAYTVTIELFNDNYVLSGNVPEMTYTVEQAELSFVVAIDKGVYGQTGAPYIAELTLNGTETFDAAAIAAWSNVNEPELYAVLKGIDFTYSGKANGGTDYLGDSYPQFAGNYTVSAAYAAGGNYSAADDDAEFVVARADLTDFTVKVSDFVYNGLHIAGGTPVMTGGNPQLEGEELSETVSYFVLTGADYESAADATDVGHYKIVRTSPQSDNYNEAVAECEFTVSPAAVSVGSYTTSYKFGSVTVELKDSYDYVIGLTASVSADFADEITYSTELIGDHGSEQGYLNVGSYTLKIVLTNGNYAFTEGAGEIAIEIVPSENKFVSVTKRDRWIYGNKPADINVSVAYGSANIVTYDSEGNVVELSAATYAGSYYDRITVPASEFGNYAAIEYAGDTSFVIGKATFKWSWEFLPDNIVYGDSLDGAFVINEPEVTGGIESDFVYFVYNTNAVYSVGGEVYSYDPQTDAGTVVTISAQCVWSDETPEGIKTSYVIDPDEFGAIAFNMEVQKKPIAVTAVSLSDIYGSAFDPTGDANEYFGGAFLYNGAPITNLTAQNSVVVIEISGSGLADDRLNAGNYTVTVSVGGNHYIESAEDGTLENGCVSVGYTVMPKTLNISDGIKSLSYEFGMLSPEDLNASDAILNFIGGANGLFDGLAFGDSLTPDDFTLSAAQDYSAFVSEGYMIVSAEPYIVNVALSATSGNYIAPETGLDDIGIYVVKAANRIYGYSVPGWTYLDVLSEYIPSALPSARFGVVEYGFFAPDGSEMTMDKFNSETPAGTYTFRLSVAETDNYSGATRTGSFVVDKLIVVAELTATDVTYDGAVYDGISYTLSPDVSDYIGTVGYEYSENGSAFRKGLPTDAGNYSVRIGEYSDSENIELRAETVDFQINPAPMHFTVTGVDGASIEYGTAIDDIDVNALIASVIPDSYVGGFEFTVSLITANGTAYRPGLYAGTTLYATVDITLNSNNYYPVVDTAIEMLPKVNITKVSHDMAFEISDEIITDGSSAAVIEGSANTVIDAISYYMAINDIQYYEYHITVDGEEYSRDFVWAPGTHTVEVRLSGNHEGSTQFTVVIEEDPDAVDRAPFTPKTVVGEVLESINFTWASAVSIAFGVAVAALIILFFGLRRAKRK